MREMPVLRCGIEFLCYAHGGGTGASISTVVTRQEKISVKASRYLARIITITGALGSWNLYDGVRYDTAQYEFWIYAHHIDRIDKRTGEELSTCWKPPKKVMPYAEAVATALLFLHDSPAQFEVWRKQAKIWRD